LPKFRQMDPPFLLPCSVELSLNQSPWPNSVRRRNWLTAKTLYCEIKGIKPWRAAQPKVWSSSCKKPRENNQPFEAANLVAVAADIKYPPPEVWKASVPGFLLRGDLGEAPPPRLRWEKLDFTWPAGIARAYRICKPRGLPPLGCGLLVAANGKKWQEAAPVRGWMRRLLEPGTRSNILASPSPPRRRRPWCSPEPPITNCCCRSVPAPTCSSAGPKSLDQHNHARPALPARRWLRWSWQGSRAVAARSTPSAAAEARLCHRRPLRHAKPRALFCDWTGKHRRLARPPSSRRC